LPAFLIKHKSKNQQLFMLEQAKKTVERPWKMEKSKGSSKQKAYCQKKNCLAMLMLGLQ
jgi:hypothetical protein